MKNLINIIVLLIICNNLIAHNLQVNLSEANGYGWAPLSSTPHVITLFEKSSIYPLSLAKINSSEYKGFKIMFKEIPVGIKIYIKGEDNSGLKTTKYLNPKLIGTSMNYDFNNLKIIEKIGIYYSGKTPNSSTQVYILNFSLINKSGKEIPTTLLNNADAQKNMLNWVRMIGNCGDIIYNGSYIREVVWSPADFNKFNKLTISFRNPIKSDIQLKVYKTKDGASSCELFDIPYNATKYTFNLKNNSKLSGCFLNKMSLIAKQQWTKISIDNILLTD